MRPKSTAILLLLAAALGTFVWFYEIRGADSRREAEEREKRLFGDLEQSAIEWISLTQPDGESARLEKRDGRWLLVSPLQFPADAYTADNLASTLAGLASEAVLPDPQPPDEYGLGADARVVRFGAGEREHELRLGKDAPVGGVAYASTDVAGEIYTIQRFKASSFQKSVADLRDKRILEFDRESIRRIEASWSGGRVVLERDAAPAVPPAEAGTGEEDPGPPVSAWRLTQPIQGRADAETVDDLLSDLSYLRADGFVDEVPPDAAAGFSPPAFEIALTAPGEGEDAEPRVFRMAVGGAHGSDLRLVRGAQRSLYTIPAARLDDLPRELAAYRWKQLASFAVGDAHALDFFFQSPSADPVAIHAERSDAGWTSSPEVFAQGRLERVVAELSRLRAQDIAADEMGEAELRALGLAPPNAILTVFGKSAEKEGAAEGEEVEGQPAAPILAEVQLGHVEGSEWIAARAAGDPTVYRLPFALAEQLPVSLDAFRNRFRATEGEAAPAPETEPQAPDSADFLPPGEESP